MTAYDNMIMLFVIFVFMFYAWIISMVYGQGKYLNVEVFVV